MIPKYRCFVGNKKMFEVEVIDFAEKEVQVPVYDKETGEYLASASFNFDDIILMQSTGLFDKNGVEIFEGDVVKLRYTVASSEEIFEVKQFRGGAWRIDNRRRGCELWLRHEDCEILGNIHEHPHLVEVGDD